MATLAEQLVLAEAAYHRLMTGVAAVQVRDSSGDMVSYGAANRRDLAAYVADLKRQISGVPLPKTITFTTSKGLIR